MAKLSVDQVLSKAKSHAKKGDVTEAQKLYQLVLHTFPENKRAQQALAELGKAKKNNVNQGPSQEAVNQLIKLYEQGQLSAVVENAQALMERHPEDYIIWNILGVAYRDQGKLDEAIDAYNKALSLKPDFSDAYNNLGNTLKEQGKLDEAMKAYIKACSFSRDHAAAYYNMGNTLKEQGKLDEAIKAYSTALSLKPDFASGYNNLGIALKDCGKLDEAINAYNTALSLKADYADAYINLGSALTDKGKLDEAIEACQKGLILKPMSAAAYNNMGNAFNKQGRLNEAINLYNKAISVKPDYAEAHYNMGGALSGQFRLDEAIEAYDNAVSLKPDYPDAYSHMGNALQYAGRRVEAIVAYNRALSLKPDHSAARAQKLHQQAHICDWKSVEDDRSHVVGMGIAGRSVPPFAALSLEDAPQRHRLRAENYAKQKFFQKPLPLPARPTEKPERLRIGYFSADFHDHATMYLMAQIFASHDKTKFEIFVYSYGPDKQDAMRQKLVRDVNVFHDVRQMSDMQIVKLARKENLDIAIDLKGFTQDSRLEPFAYGLAPVQISYLGYPGTLGTEFIDYIIADSVVIPEDKRQHYSEQIIYLPHTYQSTDNKRFISHEIFTKEQMGLPSDGFVFCCFNNVYKISPKEFDIWMRLLSKVEGSVLWLLKSNHWSTENLRHEAAERGINPDRLIFAERVQQAEHLARHILADLFLDTFNYNAHTTASDALWAGLPVITKIGQGFAARVAGSLVSAIGLPELITMSEEDYEALALELATHPEKVSIIKSKLQANCLTQPLFNTKMFTEHLERGYQLAYGTYFNGYSPATIIVPA